MGGGGKEGACNCQHSYSCWSAKGISSLSCGNFISKPSIKVSINWLAGSRVLKFLLIFKISFFKCAGGFSLLRGYGFGLFNVLIYGCFNEVAALFWIKNCHMFLKKMYCSSMGKSCVITRNLLFNFDGLK